MSFAEQLSENDRRRAQRHAILACWFGCVSEQFLDGNALVILYIGMLGGSLSSAMFSTSISGWVLLFLLIPSAGIADRIGLKRTNRIAGYVASLAYLGMASAPLFGQYASAVTLGFIFLYCLTRPLYNSVWYPLLDNFLRPCDRGVFFSRLRFSYMILNAALVFGLGTLMREYASIYLLQGAFALAGLLVLGRVYFMNLFPQAPDQLIPKKFDLKKAFSISIRNAPLVGFSVYVFFLNLTAFAVPPLSFLYLRQGLHVSDGIILIMTAICTFVALIAGYFCARYILQFLGTKKTIVLAHGVFTLIPLGFFFLNSASTGTLIAIGAVHFVYNFTFACYNVLFSSEMLALAKPGNKTMALAFCSAFASGGNAVGRFFSTMLLGGAILAPVWTCFRFTINFYQTLFLFFALASLVGMVLLLLVPAVIPKHDDYYQP